jgi:AmmeMemoRadiSam system protein B
MTDGTTPPPAPGSGSGSDPRHVPQAPPPPPFDPNKPHHATPRIRQTVIGMPVGVQTPQGQQVMLALSDRAQIAEGQMLTSMLAQFMLAQMDGSNSVDDVAAKAAAMARTQNVQAEAIPHLNAGNVKVLVSQLDAAGLLNGPVFDAKLALLRAEYDKSPNLPPSTTAAMADAMVVQELGEAATDEKKAELGPAKLRAFLDAAMNEVMAKVEDPSFDTLPACVMAPQIDYFRGAVGYAHVYGRMRVTDRPDRIIILGANNFGFGTGVVGCDKGFATPLGTVERDAAFASALESALGKDNTTKLYQDRYDHEREQSIELQLPWIQAVFGDASGRSPKVFAALVHDPAMNNGESYDGKGLAFLPFVEALTKAIAQVGGRTLVICSANCAHIGASFGDRVPLVGDAPETLQFRERILQNDKEMLGLVEQAKAQELVASMAWQRNPTRWKSVGPIAASIMATHAKKVRLLNYMVVGDDKGYAGIGCLSAVSVND